MLPKNASIRLIVSFVKRRYSTREAMACPPERQADRRRATVGIGLAIGLGVFFRFYHLEEKLLWHDELATRVFAAGYTVEEWKKELFTGEIFDVSEVQKYQHNNPDRSVVDAIVELAENDPQHPPLYYALTRIWETLFGDAIGTLRSLSVIFGLLCLPAIFWLAMELFESRRAAWMSVVFLSLSPFFVLYAQEAREYALWTLLALLSNACLLRAIRRTEEGPGRAVLEWGLYALITILSLYTSFSTVSMMVAQVVYLCLRERRPTRVAVSSFLALAVASFAFLPWVVTLLEHYEAFQISMRWSREIVIPRAALLRILGHNTSRTIVDFFPEIVDGVGYLVMSLAVTLVVFSIVFLVRRARPWASGLVLVLIFVPIGMLLVPDLLYGGIRSISMRYLTPSWLGVVLALAFLFEERSWRALPVLAFSIASCAVNAETVAVWTKATSVLLPEVAATINSAPAPLLVGNLERHNPGNLMALSILLKPGTKMQFLPVKKEEHWVLPRQFGSVFLFSPIPDYRENMEVREHVRTRMLLADHFLELWQIDLPDH